MKASRADSTSKAISRALHPPARPTFARYLTQHLQRGQLILLPGTREEARLASWTPAANQTPR
jgi:hypothetical protein